MAPQTAPKGRAAVERTLLDAAAALLAERGPKAVSLRDVAARASVERGRCFAITARSASWCAPSWPT